MLAKIVVSGRVQGVGFRYTVQQKALEQDMSGWVQNNDDGTVSIVVEGNKEKLDQFVLTLQNGLHRFIKITDLKVQFTDEVKGYKKFQVKY